MGVVLLIALFLFAALSNMDHFGWGFRFLHAAVVFAALQPVIVLVDSGLLAVSVFRRKRRAEPIDGEARAIMMGYVIVTWGSCAYFILALSH
jgi:hypothetical protein